MKYAMLVYSDQTEWAAMSEAEAAVAREESMPRWIALFDAFGKADPNVQGRELVSAAEAKVVRVVDGETVVTDGPFAETKEFLAGYWIVEVDSPQRAWELAARASAAPGPGGKPLNMPIEVREVMGGPPPEA